MSGRVYPHDGVNVASDVSSGRELHRGALLWLLVITIAIGISQSSLIVSLGSSALDQLVAKATDLLARTTSPGIDAAAGPDPATASEQGAPAGAQAKPNGNNVPSGTAAPGGNSPARGAAPAANGAALVVFPRAGGVGSKLDVSGSGFPTGRAVLLTWDGAGLATAMPSTNGAFQAALVVPSSSNGSHALRAELLGTALASTQFTVVAGSASTVSAAQPTGQPSSSAGSAPPQSSSPGTQPPSSAPSSSSAAPTQQPTPTAAPSTSSAPPTQQPTPTAVPSTPPPSPSPSPTAQPAPGCQTSLQALIDRAAAGSVVTAPACIYREAVTVGKPLTLIGRGAEIRGSDVWSTFAQSGSAWVSADAVPAFYAHGACRPGTQRCTWPQQVFIDGVAQREVASGPAAGQFALDAGRHVILGSDPRGRLVEVTMRTRWLLAAADDVTVDGFQMRHSANDAQTGAIEGDGSHARLTIKNSTLSDAHGAVVSLMNRDSALLNSDIRRGGQLGIHGSGDRAIFRGNQIHDNNTEDFDASWEAGGFKSIKSGQTVDGNEVFANDGPGIWYDVHASSTTIANNRVHHNAGIGIFYETSTSGRIMNNVVWENGWAFTVWAWGAGILVSTSNTTEVSGNIVAWNADGIGVIAQSRADSLGVAGNYVHDNTIAVSHQPGDASDIVSLGWIQDYAGDLFDAALNNRGANNAYWIDNAEPSYCRFNWAGCAATLAAFNATPGEEGGSYLSNAQKDSVLAAAGVPTQPARH